MRYDSEGHSSKLVQAMVCGGCRLLTISFIHFELPIAAILVNCGEYPGIAKRFNEFVQPLYLIKIPGGYCIEFTIFYTKR